MGLLATLRNIRAYWYGGRDSKRLSRKHASLAYLSPPAFPQELAQRYRRAMEALLYRYHRKRAKLEQRLLQVRTQRQALEGVVGKDEPTPEVFAHMWAEWGRRGLITAVFSAELVYNKLAMDTLELSQLEAYVVSAIATLVMFWMGHEAGNQFRKGAYVLASVMGLIPLAMAATFAFLRFEFTRRMALIAGDPAPGTWALVALLVLGLGLVAFTVFLGYKTPHERELLLRRYYLLQNQEKLLSSRLFFLHQQTQRHLDYLGARFREEVAAYWRGFSRAWPNWDPAPEFTGALPPLEPPRLPPSPEPPEPPKEARPAV
ncbi:hypothetical protein DV704_06360 [Meiothermus sp. QL-1]|uniref:hypothetical protein n=1 Tax=Meiothermus sp. QL-1 TaxID=2058095 RepID=UPI000E0BBECE|nr:hypothetical protein [Meiothermus sp. QL-1]RDI95501.1 hypothetical protein DV704_06360 [Meiothermus sp. QL-1]